MSVSGGFHAVLFDLDGTLLDTAPDMVATLNDLVTEVGAPKVPFETARAYVSKGAFGLIDLALGEQPEARRMSLRDRYLDLYRQRLTERSALFAGMEGVLQQIEAAGRTWGVVTNKPGFLAEPLLAELGLLARSAATVSGDTLPERKPHPLPLLHAAESIGVAPADTMYVGDDARDVEAGKAAGMTTVAALWGFIPPDEDPQGWRADHSIEHPGELLPIIFGSAADRSPTD